MLQVYVTGQPAQGHPAQDATLPDLAYTGHPCFLHTSSPLAAPVT